MEDLKIFLSSPIFNRLTSDELTQIQSSSAMRKKSYKKGTTIFHMGDVIRELGIVVMGSAIIESIDLWGNKSILNFIAEGEVFAETYAICHAPLMVDVVAAEESEILFLNTDMLMNSKSTEKIWHDKILQNMLNISMHKNLALSSRIFCTSSKSIRGRLLTYFTNMSVKEGATTFQIPFDRQQLADYLNVDRSALSKELGHMRDEGMIEFYKNTFRILQEKKYGSN